jgi:hypothetical protein
VLWFAIWVALVLGALVVLGSVGYVLFRKAMELAREMGKAAELMSRAAEQVERLQRPETDAAPAVFADPHQLRRDRQRLRRHRPRTRRMRASRAGG